MMVVRFREGFLFRDVGVSACGAVVINEQCVDLWRHLSSVFPNPERAQTTDACKCENFLF